MLWKNNKRLNKTSEVDSIAKYLYNTTHAQYNTVLCIKEKRNKMKSLFVLNCKQHSQAYSFMPVALWSATEISNDRTLPGTQGPGDSHS
jgi:hypothetical protein